MIDNQGVTDTKQEQTSRRPRRERQLRARNLGRARSSFACHVAEQKFCRCAPIPYSHSRGQFTDAAFNEVRAANAH
jgi:hypothetical protein